MKETINQIKSYIKELSDAFDTTNKENQKLIEEIYNKTPEIPSLEKEIEKLKKREKEVCSADFSLNESEQAIADRFMAEHSHSDSFSYIFVPTSIGVLGDIRCNRCLEKITFRDIL